MTEKKLTKVFFLPFFYKRKNKGFSLIELLVSLLIFSLIIGIAVGIFVTTVRNQRQVLIYQQLLDQASYALEYISRALRMSIKEISAPSCLSQNDLNYEITRQGKGIKFVNYKGECQEFFLEESPLGKRLKESRNGEENYLTSDDLEITAFNFNLIGSSQNDKLQPRVTISLEIKGEKKLLNSPRLKIQTTISKRSLDVE